MELLERLRVSYGEAEKICDDVMKKIIGTSLDNKSEITALAGKAATPRISQRSSFHAYAS
jgi:hypothetical protein